MREVGGDQVPTELREVVEFYREVMTEVKFPDVDLEVLEAGVSQVNEQAQAVESARAALEAARGELEAAQQELRQTAQRAIAYARVYVQGQPEREELDGRLDALEVEKKKPARGKSRKPRKKRGRRAAPATTERAAPERQQDDPTSSRMEELPFIEPTASVDPLPDHPN